MIIPRDEESDLNSSFYDNLHWEFDLAKSLSLKQFQLQSVDIQLIKATMPASMAAKYY